MDSNYPSLTTTEAKQLYLIIDKLSVDEIDYLIDILEISLDNMGGGGEEDEDEDEEN